jgi:hypothetical protein
MLGSRRCAVEPGQLRRGMLMPTNWGQLIIIILFLPPGILYYTSRANVLKEVESESPDRNWLDVFMRVLLLGIGLELLASGIVISVWLLVWLFSSRRWLGPLQMDTSLLLDPNTLLDEQWDNVQSHVREYARTHWQFIGGAAITTYVVAMFLGPIMGRRQGQRAIEQEEIQRQADAVSAVRSHVMVRLKNGTVYSGDLPGRPGREPVLGKQELILIAPISVQIKGVNRTLPSQSLAVASSEIASLALADGRQNRLFLYSDAVPPPWLPS